jgi:hypothetical protein
LKLDFQNSFTDFQAALSIDPSRFANLEIAKFSGLLTNLEYVFPKEWLPRLTSFRLETAGSLSLDISTIPLTLTKLNTSVFTTLVHDPSQTHFPSSLTELILDLQSSWDFFHLLPDNLQLFHLFVDDVDSHINDYDWMALPRNLKSLRIELNESIPKKFASSLPPHLHTLKLYGISLEHDDEHHSQKTIAFLNALPQSLTELQLRISSPVPQQSLLPSLDASLRSLMGLTSIRLSIYSPLVLFSFKWMAEWAK